MKKGHVYIGTSGWNYKHWIGTFYPADIRADQQLAYFQKTFRTVELNNSFYHLPDAETFKKWKDASPKDFIFAVKGSRYITHMKKLKEPGEALHNFLENSSALGRKRGPVLFQLPPGWKLNFERLQEFLKQLPRTNRYTFEFRNTSWYTEEVYTLLQEYNCAFCIYELEGHLTPLKITADFIYIRLHGPGGKYQGSYTKATLKRWAKRMSDWAAAGKDVYIYFDNDQAGYAAFNAKQLQDMMETIDG
ncbi:DUF72 domain-containing protein [Ohtaekwangia sp.]|uniref:DUF72 domain-containing protein n=1 Tax=Ohtaekwangia sp. TaxID=2066019 RepID=UPI002F9378C2